MRLGHPVTYSHRGSLSSHGDPGPQMASLEGAVFSLVSLNGELEKATPHQMLPALRDCRMKAEKEQLDQRAGRGHL